jgi:hypothetical protein
MMAERPTATELVDAVREFLETEILPAIDDERLRFRARVAINALAIAERELESNEPAPSDEELAELARRIRAGDVPEDALPRLKEHVAARLRISSPGTLDWYD